MPAHYKMLVSHSPPIYSHSPPSGFLADYSTNNRLYEPKSYCRPQMLQQIQNRRVVQHHQSQSIYQSRKTLSPPKPCLVTKEVDANGTERTSRTIDHTVTSAQQHNEHRYVIVFIFLGIYRIESFASQATVYPQDFWSFLKLFIILRKSILLY